jgi:uncharacterized protein DUF3592
MLIWAALIAVCAAGAVVMVPKMFRGETWVEVDGTVESCVAASLPVKRNIFMSGVRVTYSYWVNSTLYDENFIEVGIDDEKKIEALIAAFSKNAVIKVRYNADHPERSRVDPADNPKMAELAGMAYSRWPLPE